MSELDSRSRLARNGLNVAAVTCLIIGTALLGAWTLSSSVRHAVFAAAGIQATRDVLRTKNIENIKAGKLVLARHENTGEEGVRPVVETYVRTANHLRILKIESSNGAVQTIETTDEHPFKVDGRPGWVDANNLQLGDRVIHSDGSTAVVVSSVYEHKPEGVEVFNFQVEDFREEIRHPGFLRLRRGSEAVGFGAATEARGRRRVTEAGEKGERVENGRGWI